VAEAGALGDEEKDLVVGNSGITGQTLGLCESGGVDLFSAYFLRRK